VNWLRHDGRAHRTSAGSAFLRDEIDTADLASTATIAAETISWIAMFGRPISSRTQPMGSMP
jgi:hypothetical protein